MEIYTRQKLNEVKINYTQTTVKEKCVCVDSQLRQCQRLTDIFQNKLHGRSFLASRNMNRFCLLETLMARSHTRRRVQGSDPSPSGFSRDTVI